VKIMDVGTRVKTKISKEIAWLPGMVEDGKIGTVIGFNQDNKPVVKFDDGNTSEMLSAYPKGTLCIPYAWLVQIDDE